MKPIIGLFVDVDSERTISVWNTYIHAVEISGGAPIVFPRVEDEATFEAMMDLCHGFVFTGGADIAPARYGQEVKAACGTIQHERDAFDFFAFQKVMSTSKPILAICRGAQLVNVALGGTLYQDIPTECPSPIFHVQKEAKLSLSHEVNIVEGTPLYSLIGQNRMSANSFHHQAIKQLGRRLCVMATADDGIVEAVYLPGDRYFRAYQWHPERLVDSMAENRQIFEDFIEACRAKH